MAIPPQRVQTERPAIVLFSRHFPPHVSGGARRPYYLVQALKALGCRVFVVAPALPDDVEGVAVPHIQADPATSGPARFSVRDVLRNWLLWPDPDIRWTLRAVRAAKLALPFKPDWVITTSPPESIHQAGVRLKKAYGCYWYADFRDHWLVRPFRTLRKNWLRNQIERMIAQRWTQKADLISVVNEDISNEIRRYIRPHGALFTLPHFAIKAQMEPILLDPEIVNPAVLNLVHTGSFSLSDPACNIGDTMDVFERAVQKNPKLHLHLAGRLSDAEMQRVKNSAHTARITVHGVVSMDMSHALQHAAQALILAGSPYAATPPGKAAEYASKNKPIIAISEASWAAQFNGVQTAEERLVELDKNVTHVPHKPLPDQYEIAEKILGKMAKINPSKR